MTLNLRNGKIHELHTLKNMFEDLKSYINEPKNLKYKSRSCILNIGEEFKHKFDNISRLDTYDSDEIFIQVHNYVRFLYTFCKDIIIPIHAEVYKLALIHNKTYSIISEILKSTSDLISIIESKYSNSIKYMEGVGNFTIASDTHCTYCIYIEPIYTQLKNLNHLLKPYRFKTIYFIRSEFA